MGYIYAMQPIGDDLRPIDQDKRCFNGEKLYPPEANHNNVKIGKTERPIQYRKRDYKKIFDKFIFKIIAEYEDLDELKNDEKHLKVNVFSAYIRNFQNKKNRQTREWMEGISLDEVVNMSKNELKKNT
jgi:hypothetical protein